MVYDSDIKYIYGMFLGMVLNCVCSGVNCMSESEEKVW